MTENEGGPTREEGGRDQAGSAGKAPGKGEAPTPGGRDGSDSSSAGDCDAIDFDSAHDRAS